MVGNVRSANEKLLTRTLGVTETSIVPNIYARFVFPKFPCSTPIAFPKTACHPVWSDPHVFFGI
jgi:hypothetical protein